VIENVVAMAVRGCTVAEIARAHSLPLETTREILDGRGWDVPHDPGMRPRWTGRLVAVRDSADVER
jgi:hypothetical protein